MSHHHIDYTFDSHYYGELVREDRLFATTKLINPKN